MNIYQDLVYGEARPIFTKDLLDSQMQVRGHRREWAGFGQGNVGSQR